jgi:hypothetical protein
LKYKGGVIKLNFDILRGFMNLAVEWPSFSGQIYMYKGGVIVKHSRVGQPGLGRLL